MMINDVRNKWSGPGGGTRRLHQVYYGGEIGSTHTVKAQSFIRYCNHRYRAIFINAKQLKARRVAANRNTLIGVDRAA